MKPKELQELIDFIAKSGLNKVDIETEEFKLSVKRDADTPKIRYVSESPTSFAPAPPVQSSGNMPSDPASITAPATTSKPALSADESRYVTIKAPMIGTLYRSATPESPVFVNVGDEITKGQVICIIEAMKLFNEIEAEVSGKVVKVLVENASPVEYDQPLFLVDPS